MLILEGINMSALFSDVQVRAVAGAGASSQCLIVRAGDSTLAFPTGAVQGMVLMPLVTALPHSLPAMRGVVNLRGEVMPVVDLRVALGLPSYQQEMAEFAKLLDEREQDHLKWIAELRASADENRAFTLARDPHKCKFGKWYDTFTPRNQSVAVMTLWRSFDRPHQVIHGIADKVCALAARGEYAGAHAIIQLARDTELQELCRAFADLRRLVTETSREVAVVLRQGRKPLAVSVDEVVSTETFEWQAISAVPEELCGSCSDLTQRVARRRNSNQLVLLVEVERMYALAAAHESAREPEAAVAKMR